MGQPEFKRYKNPDRQIRIGKWETFGGYVAGFGSLVTIGGSGVELLLNSGLKGALLFAAGIALFIGGDLAIVNGYRRHDKALWEILHPEN